MPNQLIHSRSLYLLQHAHNPVNWVAWSDAILADAVKNQKLLVISIGYSACHWCHVMEHESFEDEEVAQFMNENFICIKVDKEERPDIDHIYMNAAMIINGQGGWPLNIIALPDGRPVYAGTYFPKQNWMQVLKYFIQLQQKHPEKLITQAENISRGLEQLEQIPSLESTQSIHAKILDSIWENWKKSIDLEYGGRMGAPKFIMPNNYGFLLKYAFSSKSDEVRSYIINTCNHIALGGIYDSVAGGFFRYSTDEKWHIPHFEKMLYDNAQLLSMFAQAHRFAASDLYVKILDTTYQWLQSEMKSTNGGYSSALDADSEGEEGKFYTWTYTELQTILGEDIQPFSEYYQCTEIGNWEHGKNHLHSEQTLDKFCTERALNKEDIQLKFENCIEKLRAYRNQRIRPVLDRKIVSGWNALLISGFVQSYWATREDKYIEAAKDLGAFFENQLKNGKGLWHCYHEDSGYIEAYLSDYAPAIQAFIELYQATFDEKYILQAYRWAEFVIDHFYDEQSGMFFLTAAFAEKLINRPIEMSDNVISSSNAILARCLWKLGFYFDKAIFKEISTIMLQNVLKDTVSKGMFYAEWASLIWEHSYPFYEVVFTDIDKSSQVSTLMKNYLPQFLPFGSQLSESQLPILANKSEPWIYICRNQTCQATISKIDAEDLRL